MPTYLLFFFFKCNLLFTDFSCQIKEIAVKNCCYIKKLTLYENCKTHSKSLLYRQGAANVTLRSSNKHAPPPDYHPRLIPTAGLHCRKYNTDENFKTVLWSRKKQNI